jgi:hypothetical protein
MQACKQASSKATAECVYGREKVGKLVERKKERA